MSRRRPKPQAGEAGARPADDKRAREDEVGRGLEANIAKYAAARELEDDERDEYLADLPSPLDERLYAHIINAQTSVNEYITDLLRGKVYATPDLIKSINEVVVEACALYLQFHELADA